MSRLIRLFAIVAMALTPTLGLKASLIDNIATDFGPRDPFEVWVKVDNSDATLTVYRGDYPLERINGISIGQRGAARMRVRGDKQTPKGEFRINGINTNSRFHLFFAVDYPTPWNALEALNAGVMSRAEYEEYHYFLLRHGRPPQDTVLGGNIGLHGIGEGDPEIHGRFDWTLGCVAVTNEEIERLAELIGIGTRVVIR
ncbi:L,D-transpeptidase catalytic domain [Franzmannia pantelleriensis]|uniref:L,D-transpeptidase catalytic domain n=1 Tax=Franzmannia pantelleriensis TaxID=48727 RepID=A0A1G9WUG0_9GAMM|nr:L,D-transpeptidase [Halomonas pantelleriensis]SDM87805.1 L,D-transpeptidase catalytic domain [Halomonas pantelleriensis]